VDGGASRNDLLMQFQADIPGVPVVRPAVSESTALGAAMLAGLGVGVIKDRASIAARWKAEGRFEPGNDTGHIAGLREQWSRAVERSKAWEER